MLILANIDILKRTQIEDLPLMSFSNPNEILKMNSEYIKQQVIRADTQDIKEKIHLTKQLRHKKLTPKGCASQIIAISDLFNNDIILRKIEEVL